MDKFMRAFDMRLSSLVLMPVLLIPIATLAIFLFAKAEEKDLLHVPNAPELKAEPFEATPEFAAYWYQGEAEITSYKLEQARYGEMHSGTAMLMFVAEDFSTRELTKSDGNNGPKLPVLKVNFEKKFVTGVYPYSMLMTTASPVDVDRHPLPLKVATSCQEWCGHTYTQLNWTGGKYEMTEHSYFPGEGDQNENLPAVMPEDAIWTRMRIAPEKLPTGKFDLIPGTFFSRLRHRPLTAVGATASQAPDGDSLMRYQLDYTDGSRRLVVWYEKAFPHGIAKWEENYEEGFGPDAKRFTTTATRMKVKKLAYWNNHNNVDRALREELGLDQN